MPKRPGSADEGTDPGYPAADTTNVGPAPGGDMDDEIEEISPDEIGQPSRPGQVHLAVVPGASTEGGAEKTRVASLDDVAPPEGNAEKTMITSNPTLPNDGETMITSNPLAGGQAAPKTVRGVLEVTAGKETGQRFELTDGTRVVGRSREADICLLDIQVSRKHAEIVADRNGVLVRDLGSGNGTLVNGQPITETRLVHGDEVQIGDHVLRFEEEGPVAQALAPVGRRAGVPATSMGRGAPPAVPSVAAVRRARRSGGGMDPKRKKLFIIGGAVGGLFLLLIIIKVAMKPGPPPKPPGPTPEDLAQQSFQQGLDLFKKAQYQDALGKFQEAAQEDPRLDKATQYVKATKREIGATADLTLGAKDLAAQDYSGARAAYRQVDPQSLRYQDAVAALKKVDQAEAAAAVDQGNKSLDDGSLDDAEAAFNKALTLVPGFVSAKDGLRNIQAKRADMAKMSAADRAAAARAARAKRAREAAAAKAAVRHALSSAESLFNQGEFHRAMSAFQDLARNSSNRSVRNKARRKSTALKAFVPAYQRGMAAANNRASKSAVQNLEVAESQAEIISPSGSILSKVRRKLADMYYLQGRVAFNAKRYSAAYSDWSKALRYDHHQKYAQSGLDDLAGIAKKLYLQAYIQKSVNRASAVREWKQVIAMTPPGSEFHEKAKSRLAEMGGP